MSKRKNMMIVTVLCLAIPLLATARPNGASKSQETDVRVMNYYPDGRDIVCVNGNNRYTRALYGTHSSWRLETSDRPVFATYKKNECRNISLCVVTDDGRRTALDSTDYCEARYCGGKRTYLLRHKAWGPAATLRIEVVAASDDEGAVWRFSPQQLPHGTRLMAKCCNVVSNKFSRGGDLGKDDLTKFEASADEQGLQQTTWEAAGTSSLILTGNEHLTTAASDTLWQRYEQYREELVSRVEFTTPDPVINLTGSVLMHAADGLWDGTTWQHGCVGWRTPLAGWRGAYAGDALGWFDRARTHFEAYARSQVTDVPPVIPHPSQDAGKGLSRAEKKWGTQMYSNGYLCRLPDRNDIMHHYDMNLNYIDALLCHLSYDADTAQLRTFWPVLQRHLQWEQRNFDPDGDHLYDAYCCIWASDALYYNGGAVTHSSAYNYRGHLLAARIAEVLGEDPAPYREEADAILQAMNTQLWMPQSGVWCEFKDAMGHQRQHPSAALWTVYTPIGCGACTPEQAWQATLYVDRDIPHIPIRFKADSRQMDAMKAADPALWQRVMTVNNHLCRQSFHTLPTSDWQPYVWSTNNVAHEEVANMALAYFQAGRKDEGFQLLKGDLTDEMLLGASPGNFGQISYYDKVLNEAYRDFGDNIGVTARALINGLFGIQPDALAGRCIIAPAFPDDWQEASVKTPYLSYTFHREGNKDIYELEQHFPQALQLIIHSNAGGGAALETAGSRDARQTIVVDRSALPQPRTYPAIRAAKADVSAPDYLRKMGLDDVTPATEGEHVMTDLRPYYNANVDDIFKNEYLSPRPPYTTLQIPIHGIGQWCHPEWMAEIEDDGLRKAISQDTFDTRQGLRFRLPAEGPNIIYTSLWDNYPNETEVDLKGKGGHYRYAYLMMAGSTNSMQSRIDNGRVVAHYSDHTTDTLHLENPINWCPIEQDYVTDDAAFWTAAKKPLRFRLDNGYVSRQVNERQKLGPPTEIRESGACADRAITGGAGVILKMPLNPGKQLRKLRLETLSNDVVIGLMAVTLQR